VLRIADLGNPLSEENKIVDIKIGRIVQATRPKTIPGAQLRLMIHIVIVNASASLNNTPLVFCVFGLDSHAHTQTPTFPVNPKTKIPLRERHK
jgi:hypothetical protein